MGGEILIEMNKKEVMAKLKGGLIVSCQALEDEPMYSECGGVMPLFAKAAKKAGAVGIRANSIRDIKEIMKEVDLPIIGIIKKDYPGCLQYITPTIEEVDQLADTGCNIIAIDCTDRERADGKSLSEYISDIRAKYPDILLMADIATYEEGKRAKELGIDFVGTTLCGYTEQSRNDKTPNFELVNRLSKLQIPVIAEGHIDTPLEAKKMLESGAFCVVVGSAITRPYEIAKKFVNEMRGR